MKGVHKSCCCFFSIFFFFFNHSNNIVTRTGFAYRVTASNSQKSKHVNIILAGWRHRDWTIWNLNSKTQSSGGLVSPQKWTEEINVPEDLSFSSSSWAAFFFLDITVLLFCDLASEDGAQLILYSKSCFGSVVKLPCPGMDLPGKKRGKTSPPHAVKTGLCSLGHSHQLYSALVQKYPYPSGNLGLAIPKLRIWNLAVVMLCSQAFF